MLRDDPGQSGPDRRVARHRPADARGELSRRRTVTSDLPALSAHIVIDDSCFSDGHAPLLLDQLQACLAGHFDIEHSTFQLEAATHAGHEPGTH